MRRNSKKKLISCICFIVLFIFYNNLVFAAKKQGGIKSNKNSTKLEVINTPPPGFDKLIDETLFVDVYYREKFLVTTEVKVSNNRIKILNPEQLYYQLPEIKKDKVESVIREFKEYKNFDTVYACYPERKPKCDMMNPESVELIYNPDTLTLEIVANPNIFVNNKKKNIFIEPQSPNFSQFFKFNAVGYWSNDRRNLPNDYIVSPLYYQSKNEDLYNLTVNSKTSFQRYTFNTDIRYTNDRNNLFLDHMNISRYFEKTVLQVGETYTRSLRNLNQADILGISYRSSIDRRKKDTGIYSQPLSIFLNYRSRVNIIKNGRIYSSEYYNSGNQTLNTESLPLGSYNVDIEIVEPNGKTRRESQFFVKNAELPPVDQAYFWLEFGAIEDYEENINFESMNIQNNSDNIFNRYKNDYVFRTGIYKRIFKTTGLGANIILNKGISGAEIFSEFFGKYLSLRTGAATDSEKDYSYNIYGEITRFKNIILFGTWTQNYLTKNSLSKNYSYRPISTYSKQGNATARYYFGNSSNSLGFKWNYYKDIYDNETYSVGPDLELNFSLGTSTTIRCVLSGYRTDIDYQASLNFFFNFNSKYLQLYNNSSYRMNKERKQPKDFKDNFDSSTAVTLQDGGIFNQDLRLTARYDAVDNTETKGLELDYRSGIGRFLADASRNEYIEQYSINFSSVFAFNKDNVLFGGREPKDSAIAIEIDGGNKDSIFDIYVNQNRTDYIRGDSSRVVTLAPFNEYSVSLQAKGVNNTYIEESKLKLITLYPGTMETIKYRAKSTIIIISRLYSKDGKILKNTKIKGQIDETTTDDEGYFQITAILGETLEVGKYRKFKVPKKIKDTVENIWFLNEAPVF